MLHFIQNDQYKVGVESMGAELQHFIRKKEQLEFIWVADPAIWPAHAPILFPVIGELPEGKFEFDGETYQMQRHGFARKKEFQLVDEDRDKLVFELKHDEETLAQYPFKFTLLVAYKLDGNTLAITYLVRSEDQEAMYFSIGGHPGFNVPFYPNEQYSDYYIEFEKPETLSRHLLNKQGLLNGDTERVLKEEQMLPLQHSYFDKDALVFKDLNSEKLTLGSRNHALKLEVAFEGFPYLGIWAKPDASPYVCIEPWCGIAGRTGESGLLKEKEGIQSLGPKQSFERTFSITVSE